MDATASLSRLELRCPPMPHTLLEALNLTKDPERISIASVTAMLERDPLVVARLLQTVNSTYYGLHRTVSSAERAVVMLGPVSVVGVVVGMSMLRLRSVLGGPAGPCFHRLVRHSIATAYLTRFLVEDLPGAARPPAASARMSASFTAGLLHDFGKIILVYNFEEKAVALYDQHGLGEHVAVEDLREMESLLFGYDHTEAGEFAALRLHFPAELTRVIRSHHAPEAARDADGRVVWATHLASLVARALGYAFTAPCPWDACAADPAWDRYLGYTSVGSHEQLVDLVLAERAALDLFVQSFQTPAVAV